jgi:hypothetical protein
MRWVKNALSALAVSVLVTTSALVTMAGPAQAADYRSFSWGYIYAGDCTMDEGATWTLHSDGTAYFDGTVSSTDSDDAWLMWAHLKDWNHQEIGMITHSGGDPKFVRNLNGGQRWFAQGFFPSEWYPHIGTMSMGKYC